MRFNDNATYLSDYRHNSLADSGHGVFIDGISLGSGLSSVSL
jgi:hypothetical protein